MERPGARTEEAVPECLAGLAVANLAQLGDLEAQAARGEATVMMPAADAASYFFVRALPADIRTMRVPQRPCPNGSSCLGVVERWFRLVVVRRGAALGDLAARVRRVPPRLQAWAQLLGALARGDLPWRLLHLRWFDNCRCTGEALASLSAGGSLHFAVTRKQPAAQHFLHRRPVFRQARPLGWGWPRHRVELGAQECLPMLCRGSRAAGARPAPHQAGRARLQARPTPLREILASFGKGRNRAVPFM